MNEFLFSLLLFTGFGMFLVSRSKSRLHMEKKKEGGGKAYRAQQLLFWTSSTTVSSCLNLTINVIS